MKKATAVTIAGGPGRSLPGGREGIRTSFTPDHVPQFAVVTSPFAGFARLDLGVDHQPAPVTGTLYGNSGTPSRSISLLKALDMITTPLSPSVQHIICLTVNATSIVRH
jgi:hypothetical protein